MTRAGGIAAAVLGLALVAPPAGAQTKEELDRARTEFSEGVALMAADNCAAALPKFQSVARVKRTPQVLFNIGECEERTGDLVSALGNYRLAADAAEGDRKAKDVAARVGERITSLEARIPKLTIQRGSGAETATILLDDAELGPGQIAAEMPVNPGNHVVIGRVGDRVGFRETVTLEEKGSKTLEVVIELAEEPVKKPPPPPPPVEAPPKEEPSMVPGIAALSAGVAFGVLGAVFWGLRSGAASDLEDICGEDMNCPPSAEDTADKGKLYNTLAIGSWGLGAVGIGVGVALLVTSGGDDKPAEEGTPGDGTLSDARRRRPSTARGWMQPRVLPGAPGADVGGISVIGKF